MLTIRQDARYQGKDWWQWSVWIEGPDQELDDVRCVTYHLHSTFPKPERKVEDRATKFRLDSAGWGGFTLRAVIETKNGGKTELSHELLLEYPPGADTEAPQRGAPQLRVFLSYSTLDERIAESVRQVLTSRGVEVLDPSDLLPGQDFSAEIQVKLRKADCVVALVSGSSGRSVMSEIDAALKSRTKVVVVELGESHLPIPSEIPRVPLRNERDVEAITDSLLETIRHTSARAPRR